jgi:uncharacterized protein (TIGR02466 family)
MKSNCKIKNYAIFPSIVTEVECLDYETIKDSLIEWIYNYRKENSEGLEISNRGGWHSKYDFFTCNSFDPFLKYICSNIENSLIYACNLKLVSMWININQKGNYNKCHCHPGATLSGVFWIKTPDNCGNLVLRSDKDYSEHELLDSISEGLPEKYNYYSSFVFTPKEGSMVLFPSHILHDVEMNESESDRISIAFNLKFVDIPSETIA